MKVINYNFLILFILTQQITGFSWEPKRVSENFLDSTCLVDTVGLSFNGTSDFVSIDSSQATTELALGDFSIELWVRTSDFGRSILVGNYGADPSYNFEISNNGQLRMYLSGENHYADIGLADGVWHHIVVTVEMGVEVKMYKDGLQVYQGATSASPVSVSRILQIGKDNRGAATHYFSGAMDEIRIWSTVLDSAVIGNFQCNSISNTHPNYSDLVTYLPLNENTGDTIQNQGSVAGNATIQGPSWISTNIPIGSSSLSGRYGGKMNNWWKGNTHTHPEAEIGSNAAGQLYHQNDYDFLVLTEHRRWLSNSDVNFSPRRNDYLIIRGEEFHSNVSYGAKHVSILNSTVQIGDLSGAASSLLDFYNSVYTLAASRGGYPIMNHPTYQPNSAERISANVLSQIQGFQTFELHNGNQQQDPYGIFSSAAALEDIWDTVLTLGDKWYGVASDDFHEMAPGVDLNPFTGWIMVKTSELSVDSVMEAIRVGNFYGSNGVILEDLSTDYGLYKISIDTTSTEIELARRDGLGFVNPARPVITGTPGYRIDFIGEDGIILKTVNGLSGEYQVEKKDSYVRARVTYLRSIPGNGAPYSSYWDQKKYVEDNNIVLEEYYAWGQPFFTDTRHEGGTAKFGCIDAGYLEYDPTANISEPAACLNSGIFIRNLASSSIEISNGLEIEIGKEFGDYSIDIRALTGKLVKKIEANPLRKHTIVGLIHFGSYYVIFNGKGKSITKRILVR